MHCFLSNSCLLLIVKALQIAHRHAVISDESLREAKESIATRLNTDLSTSVRFFSMSIPLLYDPKHWGTTGIVPLMRLARDKAVDSGDSSVEKVAWQVREAEALFRCLREARNHAVHNLEDGSECGPGLSVCAIIKRVIDLIPTGEADVSVKNDLLERADELIHQYTSKGTESSSVDADSEVAYGELKEFSSRMDRIEELLTESLDRNKHKEGYADDARVDYSQKDSISEESEADRLTVKLFKERLLELKLDCKQMFSDHVAMGPSYNFFQEPIIVEIINYQPVRADEILRMPDVGWRIKEKPTILGAQFKFYRDRLDRLLQSVDWV